MYLILLPETRRPPWLDTDPQPSDLENARKALFYEHNPNQPHSPDQLRAERLGLSTRPPHRRSRTAPAHMRTEKLEKVIKTTLYVIEPSNSMIITIPSLKYNYGGDWGGRGLTWRPKFLYPIPDPRNCYQTERGFESEIWRAYLLEFYDLTGRWKLWCQWKHNWRRQRTVTSFKADPNRGISCWIWWYAKHCAYILRCLLC